MTAATPPLVADNPSATSVTAPASGAPPQDDVLAASSFAALLHIANFVADAPAYTGQAAPECEPMAGESQEARPAQHASAVEGLLFLSSVIAPDATPTTRQGAAAPARALAGSRESIDEAPVATRAAAFASSGIAFPLAPQALPSSDAEAAAQPADIDAAALFAAAPAKDALQDDRASIVEANIVALPARDDASRSVENVNDRS